MGPSVSFTFRNLRPYTLGLHTSLGQGFGLNLERSIPEDGSSNFGYKVDLNLGQNNVGFTPTVMYRASENVEVTAQMGVDLAGDVSQMCAIVYKLQGAKQIHVSFSRSF
jgi:hypothetical protein